MYVEVYYLTKTRCTGRKLQHYERAEAEGIYMRTIGKMTENKTECMVTLREDNHELVKSELIKP